MQNRVLSELLVEHVEPGHVQSTRHLRFHRRLALYWPRAALRTPARLFSHVRRGGAPHDALISTSISSCSNGGTDGTRRACPAARPPARQARHPGGYGGAGGELPGNSQEKGARLRGFFRGFL